MKFEPFKARTDWFEQAEKLGYLSTTLKDPPYWVEALEQPFCAVLEEREVTTLFDRATSEIMSLALRAVDFVCNGSDSEYQFDRLQIPDEWREAIRASWQHQDPLLIGRMDFSYNTNNYDCDDNNKLKLLELNFDVCGSLYESALFQAFWLEDLRNEGRLPKSSLQSNSLHFDLIEAFSELVPADEPLHILVSANLREEHETARYVQSCAAQSKRSTCFLTLEQLSYGANGTLLDQNKSTIRNLMKFHAWPLLMLEEEQRIARGDDVSILSVLKNRTTRIFEPAWAMILSNKGILPLLKELDPDSPWLLNSAFSDSALAKEITKTPFARKELYGAQGAGVSIIDPSIEQMSETADQKRPTAVVQELHALTKHDGYHIVAGSWVIACRPAGISFRGDKNPVTGNGCIFIPHYVC